MSSIEGRAPDFLGDLGLIHPGRNFQAKEKNNTMGLEKLNISEKAQSGEKKSTHSNVVHCEGQMHSVFLASESAMYK